MTKKTSDLGNQIFKMAKDTSKTIKEGQKPMTRRNLDHLPPLPLSKKYTCEGRPREPLTAEIEPYNYKEHYSDKTKQGFKILWSDGVISMAWQTREQAQNHINRILRKANQ